MGDRQEESREETSSSQERQGNPIVQDMGESSRPPQFVPPPVRVEPHMSSASAMDEDVFRTQLVAAVSMFSQVMQNPRFLAFLQPPPAVQQLGTRVGAQVQSTHAPDSVETPAQITESMETPRPLPTVQEHVAETPVSQATSVRPTFFQQPNVGPYGQGSSFQVPQPTFPLPSAHPGYFGGGSVFESMAGYAPGAQSYMPGTVFQGMQNVMPNPMYANMGLQPGFQGLQSGFGLPQHTFGMAGHESLPTATAFAAPEVMASREFPTPSHVPMLSALPYDRLAPMDKQKPYKEGGSDVKFETFRGFQDRTKALSFLQQFDAAFAGGNFIEASKVRKAATYLKGNAQQW